MFNPVNVQNAKKIGDMLSAIYHKEVNQKIKKIKKVNIQ